MINRWFAAPMLAASLLVGGMVAIAGTGVAQDEPRSPSAVGALEPHPAHIHAGRCPEVGDVVYPLNDVTAPGVGGTPTAGTDATPVEGMTASPADGGGQVVAESTTTVEASLDDLLAEEHAINVHESAEHIQNYIACGDLTGTADGGELTIELEEQNASGFLGEATLTDNGDGTTTVTAVFVSTDPALPIGIPTS